MLEFLKRFGLGILYIVISPFLLLFLILWALYNVGIFFVEFFKFFAGSFKFFMVSCFKYLAGAVSIFLIDFESGKDAKSITPKPVRLDAIDFAAAYCLFSLSVFGVVKITKGRITPDKTSEVVATNNVPFSSANLKVFFKSLLLYMLPKVCLLFVLFISLIFT